MEKSQIFKELQDIMTPEACKENPELASEVIKHLIKQIESYKDYIIEIEKKLEMKKEMELMSKAIIEDLKDKIEKMKK